MNMESIVSKVRAELVDLAATFADSEYENVTLSLMTDFQRALFPLLDERIRIKDLEQSEELRDEMVHLLKEEHPTKPAWPYLDQLGKQDRCFAKPGCKFQLGAGLYRSPSCEHFVCKNHQSSPCLAKHKQVPSQDSQAKHDAKETAAGPEKPRTEPRVKADMSGRTSGDEKARKIDVVKQPVGTRDSDSDRFSKPQAKGIFEKGKLTAPATGTEANPKSGNEKLEKKAVDEKNRPAKIKVENVQYLSMDDFSPERGSLMSELQLCQLRTKSGALVWVPLENYLQLKHEYARLESSDEGECDNGIVKEEDMNRQNTNIGR